MAATAPSSTEQPRYEFVRRNKAMSNEEVIHGFETDSLSGEFHHADHVRLAFAYLCLYPPMEALERFAAGLKRFAAARGKAQLYHETITLAYFFLIRERMARDTTADWDDFSRQNPDLLRWKPGILDRYYRESTLKSELARSVFVLPDKFEQV
ncbi:MAG TPA: hypothetical protein VKQ11_04170 [Candidatus Sulfotelmatobacter sp.]|nr:hypothetical protein [Candidatus Sulfotelmatobacter sp.]